MQVLGEPGTHKSYEVSAAYADDTDVSCHQGRLYVFQSDNAGTFHGYPVSGGEVPSSILRELRDRGDVTHAGYEHLIREDPRR